MAYMPGARVRHIDGANGVVALLHTDGRIRIRWDDGTTNWWEPDEQESMIRTGTLPTPDKPARGHAEPSSSDLESHSDPQGRCQ